MDPFFQRIGMAWLGIGHVSFGAAIVIIGVTQANETRWFPEILLGGVVLIQGVFYLREIRNIRDDPPLFPPANGPALVGIPIAPEERADPELVIEGLLLHHGPPGIRVPPRNIDNPPLAANGPHRVGIQLDPVQQGVQELAMVDFELNVPQVLDRRDDVGVEQVEDNEARPVQAVVENVAVRVGIPLVPAERDDPELANEGLLLQHDPPGIRAPLRNIIDNPPAAENEGGRFDIQIAAVQQGDQELAIVGFDMNNLPQELNRREEVGVERVEANEEMVVQEVGGNDANNRVDIRLDLAEQGDAQLPMLDLQDRILDAPMPVILRDEPVEDDPLVEAMLAAGAAWAEDVPEEEIADAERGDLFIEPVRVVDLVRNDQFMDLVYAAMIANAERDDPDPVQDDHEHVQDDHEHVQDDHEHVQDDHEHVQDDPEHVQDDPEHVQDDPEHVQDDHEHVQDDHEHVQDDSDSEYEYPEPERYYPSMSIPRT